MTTTLAKSSTTIVDAAEPPAAPGVIRLWRALAATHAALTRALDADDGTCPVLGSDTVEVLLPLAEAPRMQLRMAELAARSHLSPSGLTRRVDRLEAEHLVRRVHCPGDRRGAYAQLTPGGLQEVRRALPHHGAALERFVGPRLDGDAIDALEELLERLAGAGATTHDTPPE